MDAKVYLQTLIEAEKDVVISGADVDALLESPGWKAFRNIVAGQLQRAHELLRHPGGREPEMKLALGQLEAFEFVLNAEDLLRSYIQANSVNQQKGEDEDHAT